MASPAKPKKKKDENKIPLAPKPHAPAPPATHPAPAGGGGGSHPGSAKPHAGGGHAGGGSKISAAERRANARSDAAQKKQDAKEKEAKRKAAKRYVSAGDTLQGQADALRLALSPEGMKNRLDQMLANVDTNQTDADQLIMSGFGERYGSLVNAETDNEKAAAGSSFANLGNTSRERANALSEATNNGAGESDVLASQGAALRNWSANQGEINRAFFDSRSSINSSVTDLNVDTRTARANNVVDSNADRSQLWTNYFDARSETLTQLGNTLGQMSEDYALAEEQVPTKLTVTTKKSSSSSSKKTSSSKTTTSKKTAAGKKGGDKKAGQKTTHNLGVPTMQAAAIPVPHKGPTGHGGLPPAKPKEETTSDKQKRTAKGSSDAFHRAAEQTGNSYDDPGVPDSIKNWQGGAKFDAPQLQNQSMSGAVNRPAPQGATLRRWTA